MWGGGSTFKLTGSKPMFTYPTLKQRHTPSTGMAIAGTTRSLLPLLLLLALLAGSLDLAAAFSAPARLALLRDLQQTAAASPKTPLSTSIRTAVLEGGHSPLTRCELEALLPTDRMALQDAEQSASLPSTDKEARACLPLALSLRAYEQAVADNHGDVGATLERWRRVVALRQNRVLVPGRAAELYSQLISTLLWADEFELARQVLAYVGMTPEVYLPSPSSSSSSPLVCDLNALGYKIGKEMLDIPLEKWEWEREGKRRGEPAPLSPREQGEAIAEWHWKQVAPEGGDTELEHYVVDMTLAVLRIALREVKARGQASLSVRLQEIKDPAAPFWGVGKRGVLVPTASLHFLQETDADAVGVAVELQQGP